MTLSRLQIGNGGQQKRKTPNKMKVTLDLATLVALLAFAEHSASVISTDAAQYQAMQDRVTADDAANALQLTTIASLQTQVASLTASAAEAGTPVPPDIEQRISALGVVPLENAIVGETGGGVPVAAPDSGIAPAGGGVPVAGVSSAIDGTATAGAAGSSSPANGGGSGV